MYVVPGALAITHAPSQNMLLVQVEPVPYAVTQAGLVVHWMPQSPGSFDAGAPQMG